MRVISLQPAVGEYFPQGLQRLDYTSAVDGVNDWTLILPGKNRGLWIVVIHGHGSHGDQLFTRRDSREQRLPVLLNTGAGILSVNLRDNAWMSPAAIADLSDLLNYLRADWGLQKTVFCSGSMGGTSNLIYAVLHPADVNGLVILGAATDLASYYSWCLTQRAPIVKEIVEAIRVSYGGTPAEQPDLYRRHSVVENVDKLTMPLFFAHGGADTIIPVAQARALAEKMQGRGNFCYSEIPNGDHDSPASQFISSPRILAMI